MNIDPENMVEYLSHPFRENLRTDLLHQQSPTSYKYMKLTIMQRKAIRALILQHEGLNLSPNDREFINAATCWLTDDSEFYRQTGRTTTLAFYYLMRALNEEGAWIGNVQELDVRLQKQDITKHLVKVIKDITNDCDLSQYLKVSEQSSGSRLYSICICRENKFDESKKLFLGKIQNG